MRGLSSHRPPSTTNTMKSSEQRRYSRRRNFQRKLLSHSIALSVCILGISLQDVNSFQGVRAPGRFFHTPSVVMQAAPNNDNDDDTPSSSSSSRKKKSKKDDLVKAVGEQMKLKRETEQESSNRLLDQINPFKAGQNLRRTLATALRTEEEVRQSVFYVDEKLQVDINYIPEVLVVGATGTLGQQVVKQLLLLNCRVRVLVRDLYTETLNKFGTSVMYSQGELHNTDSLAYATTDVDKIIYCVESSAPQDSVQGIQNIVRAYQDVRQADYGPQQAAKRSLFKFKSRPEDFYLFSTAQETAQWLRNQKFENGVFTGRGAADVVSSRLRSREDPALGIDLGPAFGGFICRLCADGQQYQAFCRTSTHEYVCSFTTDRKEPQKRNASRNRFTTVRLPFENFVTADNDEDAPVFEGRDVQHVGFRYTGSDDFYLALSYIKLYRSLPEPEFVYLSDASVPRVVTSAMVKHKERQLAVAENTEIRLDDDATSASPETSYYQYIAETTLRKSGLGYAIVRVGELTDEPLDASGVELVSDAPPLGNQQRCSRADIAQLCARAVMDPHALNKSFYVARTTSTTTASFSEDWSAKLKALPVDETW